MHKRKTPAGEPSAAERLTEEFVKKMKSTDFTKESPQAVSAAIQQYAQDMMAATVPWKMPPYEPAGSAEEWQARCKAFGEAIRNATDLESTWKAFDKLAGK